MRPEEAPARRASGAARNAREGRRPAPSRGRSTMRRHWTGDVWVDASLLRGEELIAEARARAARRARLRDARPPRHGVRVWLGSALLAAVTGCSARRPPGR